LSQLESRNCFVILAEPFADDSVGDERGDAQEYAGRLLLRLKPKPPYDAKQTTRLLLSHWDVSVEQVPWYLVAVFGEGTLKDCLAELEREAKISARVAETVRFWLRVPPEQRVNQ
jgi:hypothetical protein